MNLALPPFRPRFGLDVCAFCLRLLAIWCLVALAFLCSGCMTPMDATDRGERSRDELEDRSDADASLVREIRAAGVDAHTAANYADLFDGFAQVCSLPAIKSTEDLKRAEGDGLKLLGQGHTEALVPIAKREFACLAKPAPLDEALREQSRQAFRRFAAAMREVAK